MFILPTNQIAGIQTLTFLKKMGQPRPLFNLFLSFQTHITNFATNRYVKKYPSSIHCWDSNAQPLEHESTPITTRPGLPPIQTLTFRYLLEWDFYLDKASCRLLSCSACDETPLPFVLVPPSGAVIWNINQRHLKKLNTKECL